MNKKAHIALVLALLLAGLVIALAATAWAADPRYNKALKLYNTGKYEEAVTTLKDYIRNTPDPKGYYLIAYSLYKLGRHDEANEYFRQSYLVQPEYTPTPALEQKHKRLKNVRPDGYYEGRIEEAPPAEKPMAPEGFIAVGNTSTLALPAAPVNAPAVTNAPAVANAVAVANTPAHASKAPDYAPRTPPAPPSEKAMGLAAMALGGTILIIVLAVTLGLYLFVCFCMFRIAKKLEVSAPWLAFIPIANVVTIIRCADKPVWWIVLLLVPIVGFVIWVYLWMLIAINLGRGKLFGIALALVPVVNLVLLAILAFSGSGPSKSKGGKPGKGRKGEESTGEFTQGEGDLDLPDVPSDMDFDADEFK